MHALLLARRFQALLLATFLGLTFFGFSKADPLSQFSGAWRLEGGDTALFFDTGRIVERRAGKTRVLGVLAYEKGELVVRRSGLLERWQVSASEGRLIFSRNGERQVYERLDSIPAELRLDPLPLGAMKELPPARLTAIQQELGERLRKDQQALKSEAASESEVDAVISGNLKALRSVVQEVGWIDAARFGSKTSYAAVILAKHGGDLSLLLAALPQIEKDFKKAGDDAQAFAIVYDSVQLDLGRKQRFGTQIRGVAENKPFVLPLEDPQRVDILRKEIGLPPLSEYLADASKALQMTIALPPDEERPRPGSQDVPPKPSTETAPPPI